MLLSLLWHILLQSYFFQHEKVNLLPETYWNCQEHSIQVLLWPADTSSVHCMITCSIQRRPIHEVSHVSSIGRCGQRFWRRICRHTTLLLAMVFPTEMCLGHTWRKIFKKCKKLRHLTSTLTLFHNNPIGLLWDCCAYTVIQTFLRVETRSSTQEHFHIQFPTVSSWRVYPVSPVKHLDFCVQASGWFKAFPARFIAVPSGR